MRVHLTTTNERVTFTDGDVSPAWLECLVARWEQARHTNIMDSVSSTSPGEFIIVDLRAVEVIFAEDIPKEGDSND